MKTLDQIYTICPQLNDPTLTSTQLNDLFMDNLDLDDEDYATVLSNIALRKHKGLETAKNSDPVPSLNIDIKEHGSQEIDQSLPEDLDTTPQDSAPAPSDEEFDRELDPYYKDHLTPEEKTLRAKGVRENSGPSFNYEFAPWYEDPRPSLGDEVGDPFLDWNETDFEGRQPDLRCYNPSALPPEERDAEMYEAWAVEKAYRKRRLKYIDEWKTAWFLREQKRLDDRRLAAQDNLINVVANYRAKMEESYDCILKRVNDAFKSSAEKQDQWIETTNARTAKAISDLREQLASRTAQIITDVSEKLAIFEQQQAARIRGAVAVFADQNQKTRELVIARVNRMKAEFQQVRPDDITFEDVSFDPPQPDDDSQVATQPRKERRVVCAVCRRPFYTSAGRSKYCSQACREKAAWSR